MTQAADFGVPFIDLARFEPGFVDTLLPKIETLIRKTQFIAGPAIAELESALAKFCDVKWAVGCANGTDALQVALRACQVGPRDRVLIPDMTFWATYEAVVNVGATPVTIDVHPQSVHVSHSDFSEGIRQFRPKAAILVHLYGWAAPDTEKIRQSAAEHDVILIEDCAQAFGTRFKKQSLIAGAAVSTASFYPAKVLGASGDAGAIMTNSEAIATRVRQLINHGREDHYSHRYIGWNSRMGAYEATFLLASLPYLPARLASRRKICETYRQELQNLPLKFLSPSTDVWENGYLSVATIEPKLRPGLIEHLKEKRIGFGIVYPGAMSRQSGAKETLGGKIDYGHADKLSKSVVNLPCFAYMTEAEVSCVIQTIKKYFQP